MRVRGWVRGGVVAPMEVREVRCCAPPREAAAVAEILHMGCRVRVWGPTLRHSLELGHLRVWSRDRSRRRQARLWEGGREAGKGEGSSAQGKGSGSTCTCPMGAVSLKTIQSATGLQPGMVSDTA